MVDLTKLDAAVMAQHLGKPDGEIGRALADAMAERNRPAYEAAIKRVGLLPSERLVEIGFGNGKLVPICSCWLPERGTPASISRKRWSLRPRRSTPI